MKDWPDSEITSILVSVCFFAVHSTLLQEGGARHPVQPADHVHRGEKREEAHAALGTRESYYIIVRICCVVLHICLCWVVQR